MRRLKVPHLASLVGILSIALLFVVPSLQNNVSADTPSVVVNELMYNPSSAVDNDEFLELYNTTSSTVDLSGWCFTRGIALCFNTGVTIASYGYLVISPNAAQTLSTYGSSTSGTYTGRLDNGGERITLVDQSTQVINDFTYDDASPWPSSSDGGGPSLELRDPSYDYTQAGSWGASIGAPTPSGANSVYTLPLPTLNNLNMPQDVSSAESPVISVHADNITSISLVYKVMFGAEQTLAMNDSGTGGDSVYGDGVFSATIPAQAAGQLIRYKIEASNGSVSASLPGTDDTIDFEGYVVQDPNVTSQVPILQWFMEDSQRDEMTANHSFDDLRFPCVIAYGNTVIDNSEVHIKGGVKRNFDKKSFAFDLPQGHKLKIDSEMDREVDEFHLDSDYLDPSSTLVTVGWQIAKESGLDTQQIFKVRLQNNAEFYGLYTFLEEDDKQWRQEYGYDNMSYYGINGPVNNLVQDHVYEIQLWHDALTTKRTPERRTYAIDNSDIPNMLNYMAFMTVIHNCEWQNGKNMIKAHDVLDTNRWKILAHDIDCMQPGDKRMMHSMDVSPGTFTPEDRFQFNALYEEQDFRENYYRRLRTLADMFFSNDRYINMIDELYAKIEPDVQLDIQRWPNRDWPPEYYLNVIKDQVKKTKTNLLVRFRYNNVMPAAQSENPVVSIDDIHVDNGNHQSDYIKLKNNTSEAIDISGWYIPEVTFSVPAGSVVAPGQEAYIPRHDMTFKLAHSGSYVIGQLKQDLPILGQITLERQNETTSDVRSVF